MNTAQALNYAPPGVAVVGAVSSTASAPVLPSPTFTGSLLLPPARHSSSPSLAACVTCPTGSHPATAASTTATAAVLAPTLLHVERDRDRPNVRLNMSSAIAGTGASSSPIAAAASPLSATAAAAYGTDIYHDHNAREYSPPGANRIESASTRRSMASSPSNASEQLTLRSLVGTKDAGVVIGRQGANIKAIREVSKARVGVSGHVPGVPERIISISGCGEEIAKAYAEVARNLNQCDLRGSSLEAVESTPLTIRFLIPNSRMGRLIGKGGARINQIQKESNARLKALPNPMPNSGDRILEMNGVPDAIHIATYHMLETIKNQSDRPCHDRPYRPECSLSAQITYPPAQSLPGALQPHSALQLQNISAAPGVASTGPSAMYTQHQHQTGIAQVHPHQAFQQHQMHQQHQQQQQHLYNHAHPNLIAHSHQTQGQGQQQHLNQQQAQLLNHLQMPLQHPASVAHSAMQGTQNYSGAIEVRKFICPPHKIGAMIGKGGQRINRVRSDTGCKINVEDIPDDNSDRVFTISGPPGDVDMAHRILEGHLCRELTRDADGIPGGATSVGVAKGLVSNTD